MSMKRFAPGQSVWVRFFNGMNGGFEQWIPGTYFRLDSTGPLHGVHVDESTHYFLDMHIVSEYDYALKVLVL